MSYLINSYGVYPGGQSENPLSAFYDNYINIWIKGEYLPLIFAQNLQNITQSDIIAEIVLNPSR
ncbi:penicillin acylase family protein [Caldisphaera sp.]|uniref:penicillin acylase family protein n=1 Tax=Caldisphaera sp. TaxID=2060322 RepID=UPI003D0D1531